MNNPVKHGAGKKNQWVASVAWGGRNKQDEFESYVILPSQFFYFLKLKSMTKANVF